MSYEFTQVRVQRIQVFIFLYPLVQPVNAIGMTKVVDPWWIPLGGGCFRKPVPEFMEPYIENGFMVMIPLLVRKERLPPWQTLTDDTVIPAEQVQHIRTDIEDTGFPPPSIFG